MAQQWNGSLLKSVALACTAKTGNLYEWLHKQSLASWTRDHACGYSQVRAQSHRSLPFVAALDRPRQTASVCAALRVHACKTARPPVLTVCLGQTRSREGLKGDGGAHLFETSTFFPPLCRGHIAPVLRFGLPPHGCRSCCRTGLCTLSR